MSVSTLHTSSQNITKVERISVHSHIRNLGVDLNTLKFSDGENGMVGQLNARRAAAIVVQLVKESKIGGKGVLIAGKPGSGKTALALAMSNSLGKEVPFEMITAGEVFSLGVSKTEALTQSIRRSIGIKMIENIEIIKGEVVEIQFDQAKTGSFGKLTLKTTDMETVYDLGERMISALMKENISSGDIITIDKANGKIVRLGRSFSRAKDFDAQSGNYRFMACPEGELQSSQKTSHTVSLHEIDLINSKSQGFLAIFSGDSGEIKNEVRSNVNKKVLEWIENGKASIIPGVLFIDEVHLLDLESFSFINRAMEDEFSPLIVMASNKGNSKIRDENDEFENCPHGIPYDLLDRLLIISTSSYSQDEIKKILEIRAIEEDITLDEDALNELTRIGSNISMRYSMNVLSASLFIARRYKSPNIILKEHIERAFSLFLDEKRSAEYLA